MPLTAAPVHAAVPNMRVNVAIVGYALVGVPSDGGSNITLTGLGMPQGGGKASAVCLLAFALALLGWRVQLPGSRAGSAPSCFNKDARWPAAACLNPQSLFTFQPGSYRPGVPLTFFASAIVLGGEEGPPSGPAYYNTPPRCAVRGALCLPCMWCACAR